MEPNDPYRRSASGPVPEEDGLRIGPARRVPGVHGRYWLRDAWHITRRNKALWALACFVLMMILAGIGVLSALVPVVGGLAVTVVTPVFMVGLFHLAHRRALGGDFEFGDLFIGFSRNTGPLLYAGLAQAVLQVIYMLVTFVLAGSLFGHEIASLLVGGWGDAGMALSTTSLPDLTPFLVLKGLFLALVLLLLMVPYLAALWLQVPLVYFGAWRPFPALLESLRCTGRNWVPLLWYGLLLLVIPLAAAALFALAALLVDWLCGAVWLAGLLYGILGLAAFAVVMLMMATYFVSVYTAFQDIYGERPAP